MSPEPGVASPARRTQEQRRSSAEQKLLQSAMELIAEQGVGPTSLAQIGERAGFSRGLVNHHFGSRAALFERLVREVQSRFQASLHADGDASGLDGLISLAEAYLRQIDRSQPVHRAFLILWAESAGTSRDLRPILAEGDRRFRAVIRGFIERGIDDGSIRSDVHPAAAAAGIVGQLRGLGLQLAIDPSLKLGSWRPALTDVIRAGLARAGDRC